jgi:15-cis-phytoene synthase
MNHIELFNTTALECAALITKRYSTSFSLGIRTLSASLHTPIYGIYGFVRYADEIVDTFHEHDKKALLAQFKAETYIAINQKLSLNPVLHAFQLVVNAYKIEKELIEAFLVSMEMDLSETQYESVEAYHQYIYGSAEVVGLMCLRVFCGGDEQQYQSLKPAACKLGAAFQKVNFLRDMKSDFTERGRVYFPNLDYAHFDLHAKSQIENDIQKDFDEALIGIRKLPKTARAGVYLAYIYYLQLFYKIKSASVNTVLSERIRIPDFQKIWLLLGTYFRFHLSLI